MMSDNNPFPDNLWICYVGLSIEGIASESVYFNKVESNIINGDAEFSKNSKLDISLVLFHYSSNWNCNNFLS
jgi:hypothetical protein